jgi:signal transduction histidine kinase
MECINVIKTSFFIFSDDVPHLLYYSHLPALIVSILIGIWVYLATKKSLEGKIFLVMSLIFSALSFCNLITWTNSNSQIISISWFFSIELFNWLMFFLTYFFYVFVNHKDLRLFEKILGLIMLLISPILLLSDFGINHFDLSSCELVISNSYYLFQLVINIIAILAIMSIFIDDLRVSFKTKKVKDFLFFIAALIFAGFFLATWHLSSFFDIFVYEQIGYIGFIIFTAIIAYAIVRFKAFNIKLIGAQALVWALVILVGSQFFFIKVTINYYLTGISLLGTIIVGWMIVRNVKKEIAQKERIQRLAESLGSSNKKLEDANAKLKELDSMKSEFVSLATHQIRSPLAAIKGYVSLMEEGDYGEVPETFKEPLDTIFKSTESLSKMVTDFLDVSRLDLGQMKYEFSDFDFRDLANEVIKELSPGIKAKGLDLRIKITDSPCPIKADRVKLKQVLNNLVDNSAKYTKQGFMEISVENKGSKTLFAVKDSGVGISEKTMAVLFQRFSRAKNANEVNILGTGLGLYVAKKMTEANNGRVWAESAGEGKGAQFYVELPTIAT